MPAKETDKATNLENLLAKMIATKNAIFQDAYLSSMVQKELLWALATP